MLDKKYETVSITPLKSVHLETQNNAHLHATTGGTTSFEVTMEDQDGDHHNSWFFTAEACDEAIEFFTLLRDDLNDRKES